MIYFSFVVALVSRPCIHFSCFFHSVNAPSGVHDYYDDDANYLFYCNDIWPDSICRHDRKSSKSPHARIPGQDFHEGPRFQSHPKRGQECTQSPKTNISTLPQIIPPAHDPWRSHRSSPPGVAIVAPPSPRSTHHFAKPRPLG